MDLPRPLLPWAPYLSLFPPELLSLLGPMVQRLAIAVGPLHAKDRAGRAEPDGFDGIDRRGSYEHLLITEWMLADEAPLEFARRASAGEHGFLRIARREPTRSRMSVALFDAGPNQLGTPRTAHIAALIVLAGRAESVGARFLWGTTGGPGELHEGVTESGVKRLLGARTPFETTEEHLAAWGTELRSIAEMDDHWIIGGRRLADLPSANDASLMIVADRYAADVPSLDISIHDRLRRGARNRRSALTLELPDEKIAAHLIRDPFNTRPANVEWADRVFAPGSNPVFIGESHLAARTESGDLVIHTLPNSPKGKGGRKLLRRDGKGTVIAVARASRSIIAVVYEHGVRDLLHVESSSRREGRFPGGSYSLVGELRLPFDDEPAAPATEGSGQLGLPFDASRGISLAKAIVHTVGKTKLLFFLLPNRVLVRLDADRRTVVGVAKDVHDIIAIGSSFCYLTAQGGHWRVVEFGVRTYDAIAPTPADHEPQGFFGHDGDSASRRNAAGLSAVRTGEAFTFSDPFKASRIPPADVRVVGMMDLGSNRSWLGLVCLEADLRTISLIGHGGRRPLPTAPGPIRHVAVSTFSPSIAYTTERGDLFVYSFEHEALIYQLMLEDARFTVEDEE